MVILLVTPRRFMMEQKFQQPPRKHQQLKFPVHISYGHWPADGNIIILTKYFPLCKSIQRASVAVPLQNWHTLCCPRTFIWVLQSPLLGGVELYSLNHAVSDILEESLVQSISLYVTTFTGVSTKQANLESVKMVYLDHINKEESNSFNVVTKKSL